MAFGVRTNGLTRTYRGQQGRPDVTALDAVTLSVHEGEVHGLLGPNGAGKTTLVKILCTILLPTSGSAAVAEYDVVRDAMAVRRTIGIVIGGERGLYWSLTGRQNLEYWAALYHVPAERTRETAARLLERVGLRDRADDLVETYSRGMKQRLHLARGLIGNPRVLFLDEPTTGMDPVAAHDFRTLVSQLRSEGRTILLTTHDMAEAESICDRVTLINHGRILAVETPASLSKLLSQHERIDFESDREELVAHISTMPGVASAARVDTLNRYRVELVEERAALSVLDCLIRSGVTSIRTSRPSLEEVYLHLMRGVREQRR